MFRAGFLLCIVATAVVSVTGQAKPTLPPLSFECFPNDTIQIKNVLDIYHSIYAVGKKGTNLTSPCTVTELTTHSTTISGCEKNNNVTVYLMKLSQAAPNKFIGGSDVAVYHLICYDQSNLPRKGIVVQQHESIPGIDDNAEGNSQANLEGLVMEIFKHAPGDTHIIIGDALIVQISGPSNIYYGVKACTAYGGSNAVEGIPKKELIISGLVQDNNALVKGPFQVQSCEKHKTEINGKKCIVAEIAAFHFTGIPALTISCDINLCPGSTVDCTLKRRRRRSSNTDEIQLRKLQSTIYVYDKVTEIKTNETGGGSAINPLDTMGTIALLLLVIFLNHKYE